MTLQFKDFAVIIAIGTLIWRGGAWFERVEAHLRYNDTRIEHLEGSR